MWRIAIVEDHVLQRKYARALLNSQADLSVVFAGSTLPEFISWNRTAPAEESPDLLLLDLFVDRGEHVEPAQVAEIVSSGIRVVLFTALAWPPLARRILRAGASGIIGKHDTERDILIAVRAVLAGGTWMTAEFRAELDVENEGPKFSIQEERTLVLYASGLTVSEVAASIGVRKGTAKKYLQRIREKYALVGRPVPTKLDLSREALKDGFLF